MKPLKALQKYWGYSSFRPLQEEAINAVINGKDVLVVLPTGGGKSLCYQLPAVCQEGLAVVVSPLIALMDDQVAAANDMGIAAAALHSQITEKQKKEIYKKLLNNELNLLYVSPERLAIGDLEEYLLNIVKLFAVDEAHCISHWGHEFRPEYRQLAQFLNKFPMVPRMALTATATPKVQQDIIDQLELQAPEVLIGYPDRPNLTYRSYFRYDQISQVMSIIRNHIGEGGIVYAQTRKEVDKITKCLKLNNVSCEAYHAGLTAEERTIAQNKFLNEEIDVVVATIAFGMGINRSNVRFVIHANMPKSIEHYQQESGRAGRDGEPAECVLLYSASDIMTHKYLSLKEENISPERKAAIESQINEIGRYAISPICRHKLLAEHFGYKYPENGEFDQDKGCGACDVCLGETQEMSPVEALLVAKKIISAVYRTGNRFGAAYISKVLKGAEDERIIENGHTQLKVYGLLEEESDKSIRNWIDQLIVQGLLTVTEGVYPLLKVTRAGLEACKGTVKARLGKPIAPVRKRKAPVAQLESSSTALFEKLRKLRSIIAKRFGYPPYMVFSDATLSAMCSAKPESLEDMLNIKGIGENKLAKYGEAFFNCINGSDPETAALCVISK